MLVSDREWSCKGGYSFSLDRLGWNCTDRRSGCNLNVLVRAPDGGESTINAHGRYDGTIGFLVGDLNVEVAWTRQDNEVAPPLFVAALKVV